MIILTAGNWCLLHSRCQIHAANKPSCGLSETPQIVKRWYNKSMMTISIKKTRHVKGLYIIDLYF